MKTRIAAAVAAVILGVAAPGSIAMAFPFAAPVERITQASPYGGQGPEYYGWAGGSYVGCSSSASEGNANQQTRPVMQYGQTAGGNRC